MQQLRRSTSAIDTRCAELRSGKTSGWVVAQVARQVAQSRLSLVMSGSAGLMGWPVRYLLVPVADGRGGP